MSLSLSFLVAVVIDNMLIEPVEVSLSKKSLTISSTLFFLLLSTDPLDSKGVFLSNDSNLLHTVTHSKQ